MTNADKYLKDGTDVEELYNDLKLYNEKIKGVTNYYTRDLSLRFFKEFLNQPIKPTLTEDEKTILRNALESGADAIIRNDFGIYFHTKPGTTGIFSNLFQFIQPRRRI